MPLNEEHQEVLRRRAQELTDCITEFVAGLDEQDVQALGEYLEDAEKCLTDLKDAYEEANAR